METNERGWVEIRESVSRPFEYRERLYSAAAPAAGSVHMTIAKRQGVVIGASRGESTVRSRPVTLTLAPWFHLLSLDCVCRVFQKKTVPDIVRAVCEAAGYADIRDKLTKTYKAREYVVQYNESSLDFLSRLLAEEGIFYCFEHDKSRHYLTLKDSVDDADAAPELLWSGDNYPQTPGNAVWGTEIVGSVFATAASMDDYNPLTPKTDLTAKEGSGTPLFHRYGAGHAAVADGAAHARRQLAALSAVKTVLHAKTSSLAVSAGHAVKITGCPDKEANGIWVVTDVRLRLGDDNAVEGEFTAVPQSAAVYPPLPPKPRVHGPLTGVVCGKKGEERWTDEHGRVKVRPHWDRAGKDDETASCWMRVSQPWAGAGFGAFFLPRVGDEVMVGFIDGDPDRPFVAGSVYNAANKPPWKLPDNSAVGGVLTRSTPKGEAGNEVSFADKKDEERLYFHAQKLLECLVEEERRTVVVGETGDSLVLEKGPRTTQLKKGDCTLVLDEGNRTVAIKKGNETITIKGKRSLTVDGDYEIKVGGNLSLKVDGDIVVKSGKAVTQEAGTSFAAKSKTGMSLDAGAGLSMKGAIDLKAEAPMFSIKGSASGEVNGGGMLQVKGGMVKLN